MAAKVPPRTHTWKCIFKSLPLSYSVFPPLPHRHKTSEPSWRRPWVPFVVLPWNKTNRIQVFWLASAPPPCQPQVGTSEEAMGGGAGVCMEMRPAGLERTSRAPEPALQNKSSYKSWRLTGRWRETHLVAAFAVPLRERFDPEHS